MYTLTTRIFFRMSFVLRSKDEKPSRKRSVSEAVREKRNFAFKIPLVSAFIVETTKVRGIHTKLS